MARAAAASAQEQTAVTRDDRPASLLAAVRTLLVELLRLEIEERPAFPSHDALIDYLRLRDAHGRVESARALFLNSKNLLIEDELVAEGTIDRVGFHVREVARRALELDAAAVILVHNHPSGDPTPSRRDIAQTQALDKALAAVGVTLHDHLILAARGYASLKAMGAI